MKEYTRRAIAYIAGRLISGSDVLAVYDYSVTKHFNFNGDISLIEVSVYDYEQKCYISGSGISRSYSLYHYGNQKYIDLNISDSGFDGYDYDSSKYFSGNVDGNSISLYDYEFSKYFNYIL